MPLSNNQYSAPTWKNGQAPAISAAELQAMCDTIAGNQGKNTTQDSSISALQTAVSALQTGSAKFEVGSYVGTGTIGVSNPNSITCSFAPKVIWIASWPAYNGVSLTDSMNYATNATRSLIFTDELTTNFSIYRGFIFGMGRGNYYGKISSDHKTVSWYNETSTEGQFNESGKTYKWLALG